MSFHIQVVASISCCVWWHSSSLLTWSSSTHIISSPLTHQEYETIKQKAAPSPRLPLLEMMRQALQASVHQSMSICSSHSFWRPIAWTWLHNAKFLGEDQFKQQSQEEHCRDFKGSTAITKLRSSAAPCSDREETERREKAPSSKRHGREIGHLPPAS